MAPTLLAMAQAMTDAATRAWADVADQLDRHDKVGFGAGGNPTSRADAHLEAAILAKARTFGISVLSEEAGLVDPGAEWLAVVDPLDGSRNAGRGIPFHCTSIAIAPARGTLRDVQAGVVRNLVTGDTYASERGRQATLNGKPARSRPYDPEEVLVGIIADYSETEIEEAHAHPDHHIRDLGSAALEMCLVGTGALDAFIVRKPWLRVIDIAAATLFVRESHGSVTDPLTGHDLDVPLDLTVRSGILAARGPEARQAVSGQRIPQRTPAGRMTGPVERGPKGELTWALVGRAGIPHVVREAGWLRDHLVSRGQKVLVERDLAGALDAPAHSLRELDLAADLFLTVGGDGTILLVQGATAKPVLGVNAGAIGFLAEVEPPQAASAIEAVLKGEYRIEERDKLSAWLGSEPLPDACNEVTIQTSRIAKLIQFRITVSGEHLDTLRGDGLIVSTPTGSTGYAMSVGGPLVHPLVRGTLLAPIAPFRLSARPWVVPSDAHIDVTVLERDSLPGAPEARVVVDGQYGLDLAAGQTVRIGPSPRKARFIRLGTGFYERVRTKLTR
ncbi:MAG: inositol monophosphatase family protein [Thermoplasmatota archaeon]